jgi:pyruvate/2-oxoglutarate dehydrogenase complex dihydrolipoamide acyltransferase (E2) component
MNISYLLYQAERTRSAAEQREIDAQAGKFAAAFAGRRRAARRAVTRHQGTGRQGTGRASRPTTPATVSCAIPSPR